MTSGPAWVGSFTGSSCQRPQGGRFVSRARLRLCRRAVPRIAWCTSSPRRRQSRKIFQVFMRAKTYSTRARTCLWLLSCACFQSGSSSAAQPRCDRGSAPGCRPRSARRRCGSGAAAGARAAVQDGSDAVIAPATVQDHRTSRSLTGQRWDRRSKRSPEDLEPHRPGTEDFPATGRELVCPAAKK